MVWVAILTRYNLWVSYYAVPLEVVLMLWCLEWWQPARWLSRAYRIAIPALLAAVAVAYVVEPPQTSYARWIAPGLAITALAASLQTLVLRSMMSREPLTTQDWFWAASGFGVFWAASVLARPFLSIFVSDRPEWVMRVYEVKAVLVVIALALIAWGMVCTRRVRRLPGPSLARA